MVSVVKPENLGLEFDVSGNIEPDKIRLKLGAGLTRLVDGTVIVTSNPAYDIIDLGSQFLLDPGERNGPGFLGIYDPTHTQDLGNTGATTVAWTMGGIYRPWDMRLWVVDIWYRINSVNAEAFGFFVGHSQKVENSTAAQPITMLLDEVDDNGGLGPRDPANNLPYHTGQLVINSGVIPAGQMVTWGVEAPTADPTNRYVQIFGGHLIFERI